MAKSKVIGIEYNPDGIRAVKMENIFQDGKRSKIENLGEIKGDYSSMEKLIHGMDSMLSSLEYRKKDTIVSCISGKHVHCVEINLTSFNKDKANSVLKKASQKFFPFDLHTAKMDYQILNSSLNTGKYRILVTAVSRDYFLTHMEVFKKLDITPTIVDTFPTAMANALWASDPDLAKGESILVLHIGSQVCTLIIEGDRPFFYRNLKFPAEDIFSPKKNLELYKQELGKLCEEIFRSIAYYEKLYPLSNISRGFLMGHYLEDEYFIKELSSNIKLSLENADLTQMYGEGLRSTLAKYDVATALSLRDRRVNRVAEE